MNKIKAMEILYEKNFKKCVSLALTLALSFGNLTSASASEEEKNNEIINENDQIDVYKTSEENPQSNIKEQDFKNKENHIINSGTNGSCTWEIFNDNTAIIRPTNGTEGKMKSRRVGESDTEYQDLIDFTGTLTVKKGVKFPTNSYSLFARYKATKMYLENSAWFGVNHSDNVTNMRCMFRHMPNITHLDLGENFDTRSVTTLDLIFQSTKLLEFINLGDNINLSSIKNVLDLFYFSGNYLKVDLSNVIFQEDFFPNVIFQKSNICEITINDTMGSESAFKMMASLPELGVEEGYAGGWVGPNDFYESSNALAESFKNNSNFAGTYKREFVDYKIKYDSNCGNEFVPVEEDPVHVKEKYMVKSPERLERKGYKFIGWKSDIGGDENLYNPLEDLDEYSFKIPVLDPTNELTLTAQWEEIEQYEIAFDPNDNSTSGAEVTGEMPNQIINKDESPISLSESLYKRIGYKFKCWNTKKDGSGDFYPADKLIGADELADLSDENGKIILYAQWEKIEQYEIAFDPNDNSTSGAEVTGEMPNQIINKEESRISLSENLYKRIGYKFKGWNTKKDGSGDFYLADKLIGADELANLSDENGKVILYAQWEKIIPSKPNEDNVIEIKVNDLKINSNNISSLSLKDLISLLEKNVYEVTYISGEVTGEKPTNDVEIIVNEDDLEKIQAATKVGNYELRITLTKGNQIIETSITITVDEIEEDKQNTEKIKEKIETLRNAIKENKVAAKAADYLIKNNPKSVANFKTKLEELIKTSEELVNRGEEAIKELENLL